MKTTGIIAEYNPFHNGHKYHLEKAREITGCDYLIVIMSGDYTQRGTPAIYSKYIRAKSALLSGADLVLEMPVFGSIASAPDFARCGVNSLAETGVCDYLFFGSESGDLETLRQQADMFEKESEEMSDKIRSGLKNGLTWPQARAQAYTDALAEHENVSVSSLPNDILGVEYIRALNCIDSSMVPVTLKRNDPGYHSSEKSGTFASATAARKAILEHDLDFVYEVLPKEFFECLSDEPCPPVTFNDFHLLLNERILNASAEHLSSVSGMPNDLARKLYKNKLNFSSPESLVAARKDRNYTYTRVNRCLLNLILDIKNEHTEQFKAFHSVPWLRILGFRKEAGPLLSALKKQSSAPIITKMANAESILSLESYELFKKQVRSAELYRMVSQYKSGQTLRNEYTRSVIIL